MDDARRGAAGRAVGPRAGKIDRAERGEFFNVHTTADVRRARQQHGLGGPRVAELCGADGAPAWHALLLRRGGPGKSHYPFAQERPVQRGEGKVEQPPSPCHS